MSEIRDGRFGRLSPNGQHLACGAVQVSVDGVVVGSGTTPVWLDDGSILYTRQPDGALMRFDLGFAPSEIRPAAHEPSSLCIARDPIYPTHFAWRERDGVHTNLGRHVPLMFRPTFAGADLCWCLDTGTTADLYREGRLVARTVHDVRGELDGRLCFVQVDGAEQWTCIEHPDGRVASWRLASAQEYRPHVIDWRGEEWVLSHTRDDRLLLRTGNNGIVVATGATFEPDCAVLPDGRVRVIWADAAGGSRERLLEVTEPQVDLRVVHGPAVDPFPPGKGWIRRDDVTELDVETFALGPLTWSRDGAPVATDGVTVYSHPMQGRRLGDAVQHTKGLGDGPRAATWTVGDGFIGLAFDGTNELQAGYRLVNPGTTDTARLYPTRMRVGRQFLRAVPIEILNIATGQRRAISWRGWVEAIYDGPALGDVPAGRYALIGWDFDVIGDGLDGDPNGVVELSLCHELAGPVAWRETKRRTGAVRTWFGVRNVARLPDPSTQFSDALPTAPAAVPAPTPTPEEPVKIWPYNDADAAKVYAFLPLKYTTPWEQGGLGRTEVDTLGYARWYHDAIRLLDGGRSVDATLREINRRINQIVGLPLDAWPGEPVPVEPETPPSRPSRLVGPLRIASDRSAFIDDTGPVLPVFCHAGDFLSRWVRDAAGVRTELDAIAAAGYDGLRTWTVLGGSSYWEGREVGPMYQGEGFWTAVSEFTAALSQRGLRWLVSQGDMLRLIASESGRAAFMTRLAQTIASVDPLVVSGQAPASRTLAEAAAPVIRKTLDAGNEAWQNGESDPAAMRRAVDAFRAVLNVGIWSTTSPPSEEKADLDRYAGSVFDVHGERAGHYYDKVRHIFSIGYEGKPSARLGIQSEPFGPGSRVSASQNKGEITDGVIALATGVSLMARQLWVYFSGPGVVSDEGERLVDMPGFRVCPQVRDWLPRDVMAFGALVHGGESQAARVFAVPARDETRCDHAISADGRFVVAIYGPRWQECRQVRNADIVSEFSCGEAGKLVQGRLR